MTEASGGAAPPTPAGDFRAGLVAIIGRPNVGKSTLLNALVGAHVSITSRRPQTTRNRVVGVLSRDDAQFAFVDTPGLQHRHRNLLTRRMNAGVRSALAGVDAVILAVDGHGWRTGDDGDDALLALLPRPQTGDGDGPAASRVVLALTKTDDLRDRASLLPMIEAASHRYPFAAIVPVSAEKGWQLGDLLAAVRPMLPVGMPLFDPEQTTDRSVRFLSAELVREQAFRLLGDELPYGLAVAIDRWDESPGRCHIIASIVVERDTQRAIVIGAQGSKLKEIGQKARAGIERMLDKPVYLETHVRVSRGWSDDARAIERFGYETDARDG